MTEKRTGERLANRVGDTPGFSIRKADGLKVVVRNDSTGRQRTVSLLAIGREYDNTVKKLRQIGWTEDVWRDAQDAKRQERVDRSTEDDSDALRELQEREASDVPHPVAPGIDKVMHELLTEALGEADVLKRRLRRMHEEVRSGGQVRPEAAIDLLMINSASALSVAKITDELRRRGMIAKSIN